MTNSPHSGAEKPRKAAGPVISSNSEQRFSSNRSISGIVFSGLGQGAQFLGIEWVRRELRDKLGLNCFPGTLNLRIPEKSWSEIHARRNDFLKISGPDSGNCPGFLKHVKLQANGRANEAAYLILPELTVYKDVLEIISADNLRQALGLTDGDLVIVEGLDLVDENQLGR